VRLPSIGMVGVVLQELGTSEATPIHSNAHADSGWQQKHATGYRLQATGFSEKYMASGEAKYASRRLGWVVPSSLRRGRAKLSLTIATRVPLFSDSFPSSFTTTKIVP
jgi:hypothetical protein